MKRSRAHHAALWLCVDNSNSFGDKVTRRLEQASSSGRCQEPGILRLVRHLRTVQSPAPSAIAASAIPGQRSAENISGDNLAIPDNRDDMSPLSRPTRLLREKLALRCLVMADNEPLSVYEQLLKDRMKALRARRRLTQREVAAGCHVLPDTYKKWEKRGRPPLNYIERLTDVLGVTIAKFISGREQVVPTAPEPQAPSVRTGKKKIVLKGKAA